MTEVVDRVALAIREKIGTRHQGLPKGGWGGLMKLAAIAAIDAMPYQTEIERLRTALDEACQIALGTDLHRQAAERIRVLRGLLGDGQTT